MKIKKIKSLLGRCEFDGLDASSFNSKRGVGRIRKLDAQRIALAPRGNCGCRDGPGINDERQRPVIDSWLIGQNHRSVKHVRFTGARVVDNVYRAINAPNHGGCK